MAEATREDAPAALATEVAAAPAPGWATAALGRGGTLLPTLAGMAADDRSDVVLALQRTAGNRAVSRLLARETGRIIARSPLLQRGPKAAAKPSYIPYKIHVDHPMTQEAFRTAAMQQIFGGDRKGVTWTGGRDTYTADGSPYTVSVESRLVQAQRGETAKERGMTVGADGRITGAAERAHALTAAPASDGKQAVLDEIDRRYFAATGDQGASKIKPGERGKAELWNTIRDEVLFQQEYLANLPERAKGLIKESIKGRELSPADWDRLFAVAKKIEKLPPGLAADYASKVTASTTDLGVFEASLDKYAAEMADRAKQGEERGKLKGKLAGLEEVYKKYRTYKDLVGGGAMASGAGMSGVPGAAGAGIALGRESGKLRSELDAELKRHDFGGVADFEQFIKRYEEAFEKESVNIAQDLLKRYAGKLHQESERYSDPAQVSTLYQKLGGMRAQYATFESNAKVWNDYAANASNDPSRIPGQGHLRPKVSYGEADAARQKALAAKDAAKAQVQSIAGDYPIFQEDGLPEDKRIDKAALAKAGESELGGVLQRHIQARVGAVGEAQSEINSNHELIYKMDKLLPQFYLQQGIRPGSIHDMIIQDKMRSDAIAKLAKGIALAIIGIALAVVTFGTATPAILAAGAAIVGAGLGVYSALEEYDDYTKQQALAGAGLATEPSMMWLVIAIIGAGLDVAVAAGSVKALGAAARTFNATGDLAAFTKAVKALEEAGEIEARVARVAEKAAAARKGFAEASGELAKALGGKLYSFPGPLGDPDVYKAVLKLARAAIKTAAYDLEKFIEELKLMRVQAKLGDFTPEELAKLKQAWEEAKALEAAENARYEKLLKDFPDPAKLDALIAKVGDSTKVERLLKAFPPAELESIIGQVADPGKIVLMLDSVGEKSGVSMVRDWIGMGEPAKLDMYLTRLGAKEGKELVEGAALSGNAVIIDANTAIALEKDADPVLRLTMHDGEKARVAYIKSLPAGTELRMANVTLGEVGPTMGAKGLPLSVSRESAEYKEVLKALEDVKMRGVPQPVGEAAGFADRALVADVAFSKTEAGVIPKLATGDKNMIKTLSTMAEADVQAEYLARGLRGLRTKYATGFQIKIPLSAGGSRSLIIVPLQ